MAALRLEVSQPVEGSRGWSWKLYPHDPRGAPGGKDTGRGPLMPTPGHSAWMDPAIDPATTSQGGEPGAPGADVVEVWAARPGSALTPAVSLDHCSQARMQSASSNVRLTHGPALTATR